MTPPQVVRLPSPPATPAKSSPVDPVASSTAASYACLSGGTTLNYFTGDGQYVNVSAIGGYSTPPVNVGTGTTATINSDDDGYGEFERGTLLLASGIYLVVATVELTQTADVTIPEGPFTLPVPALNPTLYLAPNHVTSDLMERLSVYAAFPNFAAQSFALLGSTVSFDSLGGPEIYSGAAVAYATVSCLMAGTAITVEAFIGLPEPGNYDFIHFPVSVTASLAATRIGTLT